VLTEDELQELHRLMNGRPFVMISKDVGGAPDKAFFNYGSLTLGEASELLQKGQSAFQRGKIKIDRGATV